MSVRRPAIVTAFCDAFGFAVFARLLNLLVLISFFSICFAHIEQAVGQESSLPANYALSGIVGQRERWDHTVVQLKTSRGTKEYFLLFTTIRDVSRSAERTTSVKFLTQLYRFETGTFSLVRNKKKAKEVFAKATIVRSSGWKVGDDHSASPDKISVYYRSCDILSQRFRLPSRVKQESQERNFLRLSSENLLAWAGNSLGCRSINGSSYHSSQLSLQIPIVYFIDGSIMLVDPTAPFAFALNELGPTCFIEKNNKVDGTENTTLRLIGSPNDLKSLPPTPVSALQFKKFDLSVFEQFQQIGADLTRDKDCTLVKEASQSAHEDPERKYVSNTVGYQ